MTVLLGVRCTDGVVIGADSIATSGLNATHPLLQVQTDKIAIVGDRVIVAGTGAVGLGQRFQAIVTAAWGAKGFQAKRFEVVTTLAGSAVADFKRSHVPFHGPNGWCYGALLAAPLEDRAELVEFGISDFQPEFKNEKLHFVSMGSGQMLAEPFMAFISRVIWNGQAPNVQTALFGVYWALQHAIKIAPGGVGEPIRLATLRREGGQWKARILEDAELQEQTEHIVSLEEQLRQYPIDVFNAAAALPVPQPPAPQGA